MRIELDVVIEDCEPLEIIEEGFLVSGIPRLNLINVIQCVTGPLTGPEA